MLKHFERWDIQIVGRFVKEQDVGGVEHEIRDQHASLLTTGEILDVSRELVRFEEESFRPTAHMDHSSGVFHHVADGTECLLERLFRDEGPSMLTEDHGAKFRGTLDGAGIGLQFAGHQSQQSGLTRTVGSEESDPLAGGQHQVQSLEESFLAH